MQSRLPVGESSAACDFGCFDGLIWGHDGEKKHRYRCRRRPSVTHALYGQSTRIPSARLARRAGIGTSKSFHVECHILNYLYTRYLFSQLVVPCKASRNKAVTVVQLWVYSNAEPETPVSYISKPKTKLCCPRKACQRFQQTVACLYACSFAVPLTARYPSSPPPFSDRSVALASSRRFIAAAVRSCPRLPMPSSTQRIL